jgi:ketosteroid isomerase-like protein
MARPTNLDRIRAGIDAFNRGDWEAIAGALTEDVEWQRVDVLPDGGGVLRGREAVRRFLQPDVFAAARFEALEVVEGDDVVMVHGVFRATGASSGIELDVEAYTVYKLNDEGLAWRVENWNERAKAESSAGLRFAGG